MNAITAYFNETTKQNQTIYKLWVDGLLTIQEATEQVIQKHRERTRSAWEAERLTETAARIVEAMDAYEAQDNFETEAEAIAATVKEIERDPESVINALLDLIEQLQP